MKNTLNLPAHERIDLLLKGEKVICLKCKVGIMVPVGNLETANTFVCNKCKNQIIID